MEILTFLLAIAALGLAVTALGLAAYAITMREE